MPLSVRQQPAGGGGSRSLRLSAEPTRPPLVAALCAQVMLFTQIPAVFIYRRKVTLSVGHYAALLPLQVRARVHACLAAGWVKE